MLIFFTVFFLGISHSSDAASPPATPRAERKVRVGYFANLTHAQALVGLSKGTFKKALGAGVALEPVVFNAGPSVVEALFADSIDLAYVGPNPAINAYVKSKGNAVRIIAGACSGGARLIVRKGAGIKTAQDFRGKKIATPQLGNTQDVAARSWLASQGMKPKEKGGDVEILPIKNADQVSLFLRGEIDAAWAPEPWASRLVHEAGGEVFLDERSLWPDGKFSTTLVIASTKFLAANPDLVLLWLKAHVETTDWIVKNPGPAKQALDAQLKVLTGKGLPEKILDDAMSHLEITNEPIESSLRRSTESARALGFLGRDPVDLSRIFDLSHLKKALAGTAPQAPSK